MSHDGSIALHFNVQIEAVILSFIGYTVSSKAGGYAVIDFRIEYKKCLDKYKAGVVYKIKLKHLARSLFHFLFLASSISVLFGFLTSAFLSEDAAEPS